MQFQELIHYRSFVLSLNKVAVIFQSKTVPFFIQTCAEKINIFNGNWKLCIKKQVLQQHTNMLSYYNFA